MNEANKWDPADPRQLGGRLPLGNHLEPHETPDEHPIGVLILSTLHTIWKHKFVVGFVVLACIVAGVAVTASTTPMYRATAQIRIDRETIKVLNGAGAEGTATANSGQEFYQTQYGVLRSHAIALKAVDRLGLDRNAAFMDPKGAAEGRALPRLTTPQARTAAREAAADKISGNLEITPVNLSGLVNISYSDATSSLAAEVANAVGDAYLEANRDLKVTQSAYARSYVEQELEKARQQLDDAERSAVDYQRAAQIINVPSGGGGAAAGGGGGGAGVQSLSASDLGNLNNSYSSAHTTRLLAQKRWEEVQNIPPQDLPEVQNNTFIQNLRQTLQAANSEYQRLLPIYGVSWPAVVQQKVTIDNITAQLNREMTAAKNAIQTNYNIARAQEESLGKELAAQKGQFLDMEEKNIQYNILLRNVDTNKTAYQDLLDRYKALSVAANVDVNNVSFLDRARPPGGPYQPRPARNLAMAAFIGLILGALIALGLEQLDETIKGPADVEAKLHVPLLGAIPVAPREVTPLQALADPRSALSEAYYSVRTALQFSTSQGAPRLLLVTSARPSEGKSTSAIALAQGFARLGLRTALIDADLRNPSLHKSMNLSNSVGLSNLLTHQVSIPEAAQSTGFDHLSFIPCGPLPPNPAELLSGPRLKELLNELGEVFDQVIIDGPPVMGLADAPSLAAIAEGTVLVVEAGSTKRGMARAALTRLRSGPVKVVGAILSKFQAQRAGYGYGSGYGANYAYAYEYGGKKEETAKSKGGLGGLIKRKKG